MSETVCLYLNNIFHPFIHHHSGHQRKEFEKGKKEIHRTWQVLWRHIESYFSFLLHVVKLVDKTLNVTNVSSLPPLIIWSVHPANDDLLSLLVKFTLSLSTRIIYPKGWVYWNCVLKDKTNTAFNPIDKLPTPINEYRR